MILEERDANEKRLVLTKDTRREYIHHPTCFAGNRAIKHEHKGLLSFFFLLKLEIFSFTGV